MLQGHCRGLLGKGNILEKHKSGWIHSVAVIMPSFISQVFSSVFTTDGDDGS